MAPGCISDESNVPPPAPIGDLDIAVRWLSEITGESTGDVRNRLSREGCDLGINVSDELDAWNITPYEWGERLAEFYQQSNAFLFESFVYNSLGSKHALRRWIVQFLQRDQPGMRRVLVYGDGLGFDSAYLARCGYETAYFEVGQPCVQFAKRVFALNQVDVEVHDRQETLPSEAFDVVLCLDVLEHVPDPPALVRQLASYLHADGRLFVHAPYWFIHPCVKTHLRSNVRYCGDWRAVYQPAGLRPIEAGFLWYPIVLAKDSRAKPVSLGARLRIVISSWLLRFSRVSTVPLVVLAKCFFAPKPDRHQWRQI